MAFQKICFCLSKWGFAVDIYIYNWFTTLTVIFYGIHLRIRCEFKHQIIDLNGRSTGGTNRMDIYHQQYPKWCAWLGNHNGYTIGICVGTYRSTIDNQRVVQTALACPQAMVIPPIYCQPVFLWLLDKPGMRPWKVGCMRPKILRIETVDQWYSD